MFDDERNSRFAKSLREEIENSQRRRHEFCIKKLALSAGLLGLGSLKIPFKETIINLTSLLWLVPIISLAFDLYIVSEDFGIKRAGAFLANKKSGSSKSERLWESKFVQDKDNPFGSFAFFIVSFVFWCGATMILVQSNADLIIIIWSIVILFAEIWLLIYSLQLREKLKSEKSPN